MNKAEPAIKNPAELALLERIDAYLAASGVRPTVFAQRVNGDPKLLTDMRNGREIKLAIAQKIEAELAAGWAAVGQQGS